MRKKLKPVQKKIMKFTNSFQGGGGLVRDEELPEFKAVLKNIIQQLHTMRTRSFEYLRQQVIPVMEEIHKKSGIRKTKNNMFSKRFWHSFLHKEENEDLKTLWEGIPKKNAKKPSLAKDLESEDDSQSELDLTFDASRKSSGYQEIPECDNLFVNGQQQNGEMLQLDSPLPIIQQEQDIDIDFESLNRELAQDHNWAIDFTAIELINQSSFAFPSGLELQIVKNNDMEEEMLYDTDFLSSDNLTSDFNEVIEVQPKNEVKWLNFFKDCENEVQSPNENLLSSQNWDDLNNMTPYLGY